MARYNLFKVLLTSLATVSMARYSDMAARVDFQTFELNGSVEDMMWCGTNDETILVHTSDGSIYRSRDRGSNWKRLAALMSKQGQSVKDVDQDVSTPPRLTTVFRLERFTRWCRAQLMTHSSFS